MCNVLEKIIGKEKKAGCLLMFERIDIEILFKVIMYYYYYYMWRIKIDSARLRVIHYIIYIMCYMFHR